ncbi:MAG: ATP-binding protein [Kofleriaceae bacterium]
MRAIAWSGSGGSSSPYSHWHWPCSPWRDSWSCGRRCVRSRDRIRDRATAEQAVREAGELERKRLGQDLHDGLAQQLVGISFLVEAMPKSPERDDLAVLIAEAVAQSRQLARGLHSHALDAGGLAAALRELCSHTERVFKIACSVDMATDEPPEQMRVHLHRIAGEAVANAAKHARAKRIAIRVGAEAGATVLEVRDDGIGISTPHADGLGLRLMAHRAQVLGGDLRVTRAEGGGTIVTCRVPA